MVPLISPSDILAGDVLLYRPRAPTVIDHTISCATSSPYTHVAIGLGGNVIAESMWPFGVRTKGLEKSLRGKSYAAVLRSQVGFGGERCTALHQFVHAVRQHRKFYNTIAVLNFKKRSKRYFDSQLQFIRDNYGIAKSASTLSEQAFFCSAFVVACYSVVGIIGDTAQAAYYPDAFAPGRLALDPTFGWVLGYLVSDGCSVPEADPLLQHGTFWRDHQELRWWAFN